MRNGSFLFVMLCQMFFVSGALAQDGDAAMDCMEQCSQTHQMCVSTATFQDCILHEPACASLLPRNVEVIGAFCTACGQATAGCGTAPRPPVERSRTRRHRVQPPVVEENEQMQREEARAEADLAEADQTEIDPAKAVCERQRGVWFAKTSVQMPDGTQLLGVCRTPEGAELVQMIEDERIARTAADTALDESIARLRQELGRLPERPRERTAPPTTPPVAPTATPPTSPSGSIMVTHFYYPVERSAESHHSERREERREERVRSRHESSDSGLHLRLQAFGHMGFTALHPTLAQMRPDEIAVPYGFGIDTTVYGSFTRNWYAEGGVGVSYDWPDFDPFATRARIWYHAGLSAVLTRVLRVGFGYLGSDRLRPSLQSAYSFQGAYLDFSAHFRPSFVITLRGGIGAAIRPAVTTATDGLVQIMTGFEF